MIDRHTKYYASQGQAISYYLILSPETEETEIYTLHEGVYRLKQKGVSFQYTFRFDDDCEQRLTLLKYGNKKPQLFS